MNQDSPLTLEEITEGLPESEVLRLRLIVQNHRIKSAMEALSYRMYDLGRLTHIDYNTLSRIINLHNLPTESQQIAIAVALEQPVEYLFPETVLNAVEKETFKNRTRLVSEATVKQIVGPPLLLLTDGGIDDAEHEVDAERLHEQLQDVLATLTPRERLVLDLKYGLKDGQERTGAEVGCILGVCSQTAYQIQKKALRKLRHPSRSRRLKDYLD